VTNAALSRSTDRASALPALAHVVPMSGSLAYHVAGATVIDGLLIQPVGNPSGADIAEAQRKLGEAEFACRAPEMITVRNWCAALVPHLPKAPGKAEFADVMLGIWLACHDLPTAVWTAETVAEALRVFEWWPPPAKVRALLLPFAEKFWRARDGLKRVAEHRAEPSTPTPPRGDPTVEEVALVTAALTAFLAKRSWNQPDGSQADQDAIKPAYLSDGALLATWEKLLAAGQPGAAVRVNMLRAKFPHRKPARPERVLEDAEAETVA
jgi:hypothetical protein